jgi:hypothetical protein
MIDRFKDLEHEVCNCLRWKSLFYQSEWDPSVPPPHDNHYWCVLTQKLMGPDGLIASPDTCHPGRDCFKEAI